MTVERDIGALVARVDIIDTHLQEVRADVKGILAIVAERKGERAGIRIAAALYAFLVSLATSLGAYIIQHGRTTSGG